MANNNIAQIQDEAEFKRRDRLFRTNSEARADAINQLAQVGGATATEITYNTMDRLLSNRVMAKFSFKRSRGKKNFSITEICSVLKEAIIRASEASVNKVAFAMKDHLRDAPFRAGAERDALPEGAAPVDNIAQIQDMDEFIRRDELFRTNPAARADAINQLAQVGGETATETTYNTMDRLLSDDIMAQLNGMQNFSETEICSVLKEAIIRASEASVNEVAFAMEDHLRDPADRAGGIERDAFRVDDMRNALPEGTAPLDNIAQIQDEAEFIRREELFRTNHTVRADAINQLAEVDGETATEITYNTMDRLLSNDVMAQFSFKRSRGKKNFSITEIYSVLKEAIIRASEASVNEVAFAMKKHLHDAADRAGGSQSNYFIFSEIRNSIKHVENFITQVDLPQIRNEEQFYTQEALFIIDPAAKAEAINELVQCEDTLKHITRRMMKRLLNDSVLTHFTFRGTGGNVSFSGTEICSVLKEAIEQASGAPENEVDNAMQKHFNYARNRN